MECKCKICVEMCNYRPCWPTPNEARKLIDAGYSDRLMVDWYSDDESEIIYILVPALVGYEGERAPWWPEGTCTFLKNDLCEIHDLKPKEGREIDHTSSYDFCAELHKKIIHMWDNDDCKNLIERWETR